VKSSPTRVGIIGAGQLGRMMALAGYPLGLNCLFLDRSDDTPAAQLAPTLVGEFTDQLLLHELASRSDVLSFDWENISVEALRDATRGMRTRISPPLRALAIAQDRLSEKRLFNQLGIPTTRYASVNSRQELERAVRRIGLPGILKTRRMGYDGKGQHVIRSAADLDPAWDTMGEAPLLYEELIPFDYEVSIIGARDRKGALALYPLSRNFHHQGILRVTLAPWNNTTLMRSAQRHLRATLKHLNYIGVLAIEFFVSQGKLIANEMAPRVHNSGHWSIEGAVTSQFENHLRAIVGLPLGQTRSQGHSGMINLIGSVPQKSPLLKVPGLHLHDYGKEPRPGRKVGHLTVVCHTAGQRNDLIRSLSKRLYPQLPAIL
jgi:5-(carboxyamino)imidazole ribonucleotide synthase